MGARGKGRREGRGGERDNSAGSGREGSIPTGEKACSYSRSPSWISSSSSSLFFFFGRMLCPGTAGVFLFFSSSPSSATWNEDLTSSMASSKKTRMGRGPSVRSSEQHQTNLAFLSLLSLSLSFLSGFLVVFLFLLCCLFSPPLSVSVSHALLCCSRASVTSSVYFTIAFAFVYNYILRCQN